MESRIRMRHARTHRRAGQWYRFDKPRVVAQNSSEKWKADLAGGTKVSLVDGQFVEQ